MALLTEHISATFIKKEALEGQEPPSSIQEILDLPVTVLKGLETVDALALKNMFGAEKIEDLAKIDPKDPFNVLVPNDITDPVQFAAKKSAIIERALTEFSDDFDLKKTVIAARMISRAWKQRGSFTKKKETKVIVLGLDNAGKTAILNVLGGKMGLKELKNLKPTKRIERSQVTSKDLQIFLWDFGGQDEYREEYLSKPEKYFVQTDLLLYVIDMQDPDRYNESFEYCERILDLLNYIGESPYALVFFHKSDPEYIDTPEYQLNFEYVQEKVKSLLKKYGLQSDIYQTSIYNFFTKEPKFSRFLKGLMQSQSLSDPTIKKMSGLADIVDTLLNAIIELSSSLSGSLDALTTRIAALENWARQVSAQGALVQAQAPSVAPAPQAAAPEPQENVRASIMSELKNLFQKRRALDEE